MCQRQKSGHLSVPPHVHRIAMLPCPTHQRPALVTGGFLITAAPPGIIIHNNKKNPSVSLPAVCVRPLF